ncbi:MAG: DNA-processing protein DprA [Armatimonadetes bacterium]|nr:DNA-processing protein DprA [Armatimonadota bacterium]
MGATEFDPVRDLELALCLTPGLGGAGITRILTRNAVGGLSPAEFLSLSPKVLKEEYGLSTRSAQALTDGAAGVRDEVLRFKKQSHAKPVRLVTLQSSVYPKRLEAFCKDPPGYLFLYGNMGVLSTRTFCVLASRDAGEDDLEQVERAVEKGVLEPRTLVTGANTAAYKRAAVVPLRWGAPRILVLDRGLFAALGEDLANEPFAAARLWRYRFDPETDLAVSACRPFDAYMPGHNWQRDELVVALSDEVRVIRARPGGNVERLARQAEEAGRSVARDG